MRELIGLTRIQVLDRLGPPLGITASSTSMIWGYRGIDGQERSDAVLFTNGVVTMTQHPTVLLVPEVVPANGVFAGPTIEELLRVLGAATNTSLGDGGSTRSWADGTNATVSRDGIVLHVDK